MNYNPSFDRHSKLELLPTPLIGREAFEVFLATLRPNNGSNRIWFKRGHNKFDVADQAIGSGERFVLRGTKGAGKNRQRNNEYHRDGYAFLRDQSEKEDGGVFYLPNQPDGQPLKEYVDFTDDIGVEMDAGSHEEQIEKFSVFTAVTGILPGALLTSGGKSAHAHFKINEFTPIAEAIYLKRLFTLIFLSDPAVINPHQPMRVPGFYRREKGQEQSLLFYSQNRYSVEEIIDGLKDFFTYLGWSFPDVITNEWWSECLLPWLSNPKGRQLTDQERIDGIRTALAEGLDAFEERKAAKKAERVERHQRTQSRIKALGSTNLVEMVNETCERIGPEAFELNNEGWKWDGNSKARGCCSWHESETKNSAWLSNKKGSWTFHCPKCTNDKPINAFTYWWYSKNGVNTPYPKGKAYGEAAKEFLGDQGVEVPENRHYQELKTDSELSGLDRIKHWFKSMQERIQGSGFEKQSAPKPKSPPSDAIDYIPGKLPAPGKFARSPRIRYKPDYLPQLLIEAKSLGWRDFLDSSMTGAGKSHRYASLSPHILGVGNSEITEDGKEKLQRVWWLAQNHRNPTVEPVEDSFDDMPVRNAGLISDGSRKTPMGNNFTRWAKPGEDPNLEGNCHFAGAFHKAAQLRIKSASAEATANPFCNTCKHFDLCGQSEGPGYGFRSQRRELFSYSTRIRSSLDSLPDPISYGAFDKDAAILDEAAVQLRPVENLTISLAEIDTQWAELENERPEIYEELRPLRTTLRKIVTLEAFKGSEQEIYFGVNDDLIRQLLPHPDANFEDALNLIRATLEVNLSEIAGERPDTANTTEATEEITSLKGKLKRREAKLQKLSDELTELRKLDISPQGNVFSKFAFSAEDREKKATRLEQLPEMIEDIQVEITQLQAELDQLLSTRETIKGANRSFFREAKRDVYSRLEEMATQWLIPFLECWSGNIGALRVPPFGNRLSITIPDQRHNDILDAIGTRYYLDATATPEIISLYRDIHTSSILWIEQDLAAPDNVEFIWVHGFNRASKERAETTDERLQFLTAELKRRHSDLVIIDWKTKKDVTGADGHWFSDSTRGTNEFNNRTAIVAIGLPTPNIGAFKDLWLTITRASMLDHIGFNEFQKHLMDAEIRQTVGRLRAVRRPNEKLTFYLVGDTGDSKHYYAPPDDLNPKVVKAVDITPAAGRPEEQAWCAVQTFLKHYVEENREFPTQQQTSAGTGHTQGYISKLVAKFSQGWKDLKKLFLALLVSPSRERNNSTRGLAKDWEFAEQVEFAAKEYLPSLLKNPSFDIATELNDMIMGWGWSGFAKVLANTAYPVRLKIAFGLFRDGFLSGELAAS